MVFCDHCLKNVSGEIFEYCYICCGGCGKVLEECSFSEEPYYVKKAARKVDDIYNEEEKSCKKIKLWEYENHEYIKGLSAKEKITKKAFEAFVRNCSNDKLAARDELAQSAVESLAKSRKEQAVKEAATAEMKRREAELNYCSPDQWVALRASVVEALIKAKKEAQENLEMSKDEMKEDDELGSVDLGCDDYDELLSDDELSDSYTDGEYENTLYQENAHKTYGSEDDDDDNKSLRTVLYKWKT